MDLNKLKRHYKTYLTLALGGPNSYVGKGLSQAHKRIPGISDAQFNIVKSHIAQAFRETGTNEVLIEDIEYIIDSTRDEVLDRWMLYCLYL